MNKTELIEKVAEKTNLTRKDAKAAVDAIFSTAPREGIIALELAKGDRKSVV